MDVEGIRNIFATDAINRLKRLFTRTSQAAHLFLLLPNVHYWEERFVEQPKQRSGKHFEGNRPIPSMGTKTAMLLWLCSCLMLGWTSPGFCDNSVNDLKTVLYVNSYHPGYDWSDGILDGIRSVLNNHQDIDLIVEFLYTKSHSSTVYFDKVREVFREKYKGKNIDAVITSDDHALDFILGIRNELFPRTPLVFCGVDHVTPGRIRGHDLIYEIKQGESTRSTIDMALKLQLDLKQRDRLSE